MRVLSAVNTSAKQYGPRAEVRLTSISSHAPIPVHVYPCSVGLVFVCRKCCFAVVYFLFLFLGLRLLFQAHDDHYDGSELPLPAFVALCRQDLEISREQVRSTITSRLFKFHNAFWCCAMYEHSFQVALSDLEVKMIFFFFFFSFLGF